MQPLLLINPSAGTAAAKVQLVRDQFIAAGFQICHCDGSLPIDQVITPAVLAATDRIVVAGGDGTLHTAVCAAAASDQIEDVNWGLIPMGTGNDMARMLGLDPDSGIDTACDLLLAGHWKTRRIDLMNIGCDGHSMAINAISGGFGCFAGDHIPSALKTAFGPLAYWMQCFQRTMHLDSYAIELQIDDKTMAAEVYGLGIGNGRYIGGGFPIAPHAIIDDGLVDILLVPVQSVTDLIAAGTNFYRHPDKPEPRLLQFRAQSVHLKSDPPMPLRIDGEDLTVSELEICVRPAALSIAAMR